MKVIWRNADWFPGSKLALVLDTESEAAFDRPENNLLAGIDPGCSAAIVLIPWRAPPAGDMRDDGPVQSFLCSADVWEKLIALYPSAEPDKRCFLLLKAILNGEILVDRLLIRQMPNESAKPPEFAPLGPAALLMAHRGKASHLQVALEFLARASNDRIQIRVGLDMDAVGNACDDHWETLQRFRNVEFYRASRPPVGPYVIRQKLAALSSEDLLIFHDSDDISCYDRFRRLRAEMTRTSCDLVGSHECRVDEIEEEVRAFRFPLDASAALRGSPAHALLHPASMISRRSFWSTGGFSTDRTFGSDTQFLLRAYFQLKVRNADSFLYIRRRHSDALTVAPTTALESPLRRSIENPWRSDFESVKSGRIPLNESSLRCQCGPETQELILLSQISRSSG
jgi:hypothetical protein